MSLRWARASYVPGCASLPAQSRYPSTRPRTHAPHIAPCPSQGCHAHALPLSISDSDASTRAGAVVLVTCWPWGACAGREGSSDASGAGRSEMKCARMGVPICAGYGETGKVGRRLPGTASSKRSARGKADRTRLTGVMLNAKSLTTEPEQTEIGSTGERRISVSSG